MTTSKRARRRLRRGLLWAGGAVLGVLALLFALVTAWLVYAQLRVSATETLDRRQAAPPGGRWLRAHDTDIHVREWGEPGARPLLLVHGTGAWAGTWVSNVEALRAAGFRVVAMDLPPFGFSERPAAADYSRQAQARRILAVAEQLGPGPITLMGHSFGGGPAAEAAMLDASRIEHLVLVDAAIGLQEQPPGPCEPPALLAWPGLRTLLVGAVGTEPAFSAFWLRQFVARKEVVTPERTAIYQQPFPVRGFSDGLGDWAFQFAAGCESPASVQPQGFRQLRIPVSLVWGDEDTITPLAQAERLKALLPRSRLTVLRGVGHIPQIEDVRLFNDSIVPVLTNKP